MNEIYLAISAGMGAFFTALVGWVFNKKSTRADVKNKEIDNEVKLAEYYKKMLDDLSGRYEAKYKEIVALYESKEKVLRDEITLLKRANRDLKAENNALRKRLKEAENETNSNS